MAEDSDRAARVDGDTQAAPGQDLPRPATEPTDFEQIARRIVKLRADLEDADLAEMIVEQLRQVWDARGAADVAQLEVAKAAAPPFPQAATYVRFLGNALRRLDLLPPRLPSREAAARARAEDSR